MTMQPIFDPKTVIYLLDMIGVIACSVSGTILARSKNFDPMGCILVAMVTAIGGGTVRDVMLNRHPLFWTTDMSYLLVITITSLIVQALYDEDKQSGKTKVDKWLTVSDAIGLSAFSLIGLKVALSYGANPFIATLMGIVTIIVGGMIRDMICNEIPLVLRKEIYISASIIGSMCYFFLQIFALPSWIIEISTMIVSFSVRMMAVKYDLHLPHINQLFNKN